MRGRFLNVDYFSIPPSQVYEALGFLNLPAPDDFPPPLFRDTREEFLRFEPVEGFSLPIEDLPIGDALSRFLSDVVPDRVSVDYGAFEMDYSSLGDELRFILRRGDPRFLEKSEGDAVEEKATLDFNIVQLETPEMDFEMENKLSSKIEDLQCLSKVLEIRNEPVKFEESDVVLKNSSDIKQKIYSVDCVSSDYFTEKSTSVKEDECFRKNRPWFRDAVFPLLEVDEVNLNELSSLSMLDKVFAVLETIEPRDMDTESSLGLNSKELIGSKGYDILDILSTDCYSNKSVQSDVVPQEIDIVTILEIPNPVESFQFGQGKLAVDVVSVSFEEVQILDVEMYDVFGSFLCLQQATEPEICPGMFSEEMNFKNFDELVVSSELAFADDAFKSLPIPILHDYEMTRSLELIYENYLSKIKPQAFPASNDIYLPLNLLEETKHSHEAHFCDYLSEEIVTCNIDYDLESLEGDKWVYDFVLSEDAFCQPLVERCTEPFCGISTLDEHPPVNTSHGLLEHPCPETGAGDCGRDDHAKKAAMLFKSMSAFDDLSFFMDPQKAVIEENLESRVEAAKTVNHKITSTDSKAPCISGGGMHPSSKTEDMKVHSVRPSENILALVRDFEKSYLTLVKDDEDLISTLSEDKLKLLSISKGKLIDCIRKANVHKTWSSDDKTFTFALLLAIKQMTWYLCFFGIRVAYLYLNKLCRSSNPMKLGLHTLYSSFESEHMSTEGDITRSHPSLAVIHGILQSKCVRGNSKALLLAEKVFWSSLKRLLVSMGLSYNELNSPSPSGNQPNLNEATELCILPTTDCLLVAYERISPSFRVENFTVIVEYGGPNASPRVSSPLKLDSCPCFHFIKVELDMSSACGQLSAGVTVPYSLKMVKGDEYETKTGWLEEVLNFVPLESLCSAESSESTKESKSDFVPRESGRKIGINEQGVLSDQIAVIVVNTKTVDKEMIISRRSTYQKVLAMEKEGVQVVERDSDLPVDLMLSPAICLVWYDCGSVSKKSDATIGASSSSLSWIGDIATNVLTSLSFGFSTCVMVFEGEPTCLATVMDSSDELYAAAGSLGINLQIFCSSSAKLTDAIILRCIKSSVKSSQVHAKMPESESLAESFLTKFPSVNPLTAHVILSSTGSLLEFMKLPHTSKVQMLQKYHVPEESVELFSSLSRYGAREDSKSVMTDSSSSVSSGHDSDAHHFSVHSGSKRKQYITGKDETNMDDFVHCVPSTEFAGMKRKPSGDFQLDDPWSSRDHEMFHFDPVTEFPDAPLKPSGIIHRNDSWPSKDPERFDKNSGPGSSSKDTFWENDFGVEENLPGFESWSLPVTDDFMSQNRGRKLPVMGEANLHDTRNSENFMGDFKGEVINIENNKFLEEDFPPSPAYNRYSPTVSHVAEDPRKSKSARKLSFSGSIQPIFPTSAEINFNSERLPTESTTPSRGYVDNFPAKRQRTLLEEVLTRRSAVSTTDHPFQEEISHFGGSPLSNAIRSPDPVQGSPWTVDFLNRVRERSTERKQKQSLPSYITPSSLEARGDPKKPNIKRKSPSMLEFFKHKGGNARSRVPEERKQKRFKNSSASPQNERFDSILRSTTPIDKRAKQTLSFAVNGSGRQTKLVWK
ncbi:shortage in chiasmata 1 [Raphanus sativus]|uniref:Protein SHORTAGE IN CHIASMATA 1 n=1 Tax=Raphanus sativus TaxID=3726 RepID=A0A6J0MPR3_RAPSA|nr:protein SHORTAGE IN CHIASMATA 1 [Raphanus sativus]KAJ4907522.1 shortage in chiasmata 1 [Raphanus sativus]